MRNPQLNPAQSEAVHHGTGPLLVIAGAGAGKTRVLTHRVAHLIATGAARPWEITAVTFTNKASREMAERVAELLGGPAEGCFVGTFHRWALEHLRRHPLEAGLKPGFAIVDRDEQRTLVTRAMRDAGLEGSGPPARQVMRTISTAVNRMLGPTEHAEASRDQWAEHVSEVWRRYAALKQTANAVDFDDMLARFLRLLRSSDALRSGVARRCRYLLVDEFQDTNAIQLELLKLAVSPEHSITAVGDEDQSIYRWRGADVGNILEFERHFPGARVVALEENYRSTASILATADGVIRNNRSRRAKTLFTSRSGGRLVRVFVADDDVAEARWVADGVESLRNTEEHTSIAVLMRTNAQTRPFEEELTRRRVPYRVVGGLRFWQRAEIRNAVAYLRLLVAPEDELAFRRVVNVPARGIGAAALDALQREAERSGEALVTAARGLPASLPPRARTALTGFFATLDELAAAAGGCSSAELVERTLAASGLVELYGGDTPEELARRENLDQLVAAMAQAEATGVDLATYLDSVALLSDSDEPTGADAVNLMTLHAAKGLEFDAVFLVGLEDGLLPHVNASDSQGVEEERRLAYVGMTRARAQLALTAARQRFLYGRRKRCQLSPFLAELPRQHCIDESTGAPPWQPSQTAEDTLEAPPQQAGRETPREKPRRRIEPTAVDGAGTPWRPGDQVRHSRFGTGSVLACRGRGPQLKLVVYFPSAGKKTLVPSIAKLEKLT